MIAHVLELAAVSKDYRGLRPLRIQELTVAARERVAIVGLDQPMAETFVNLVTGAALPDTGDIKVFGRPTSEIVDSTDWLTVVDRFGVVSDRGVLLDSLTVLQNLAVPFTLEIDPLSDAVAAQASELAREVGLPESSWLSSVAALDGAARARVRLARAIALNPAVVLLEHPTARVDPAQAEALGAEILALARGRGVALVAVTVDQRFAQVVADRVLFLDAATGRLGQRRRWFTFRRG